MDAMPIYPSVSVWIGQAGKKRQTVRALYASLARFKGATSDFGGWGYIKTLPMAFPWLEGASRRERIRAYRGTAAHGHGGGENGKKWKMVKTAKIAESTEQAKSGKYGKIWQKAKSGKSGKFW